MTKKSKKITEFPCSVCRKNVSDNHLAILCTHCKLWSHNKCNNIEKAQYREHEMNPDLAFYCIKCKEDITPFMRLNNYEFDSMLKNGEITSKNNIKFGNFTPSSSQKEMFDKLNNEIEDYNSRVVNEETESDYNHPLTCNYYGVDEFLNSKFNSSKNFSIMHLNIHSIQLHIDELRSLLTMLDHTFDIIAISESKLKHDPIINIDISGYKPPTITKTEAEKGGTMIYVANEINFKPRKDLEIYQSKDLESSFIEIINPKESNDIIGVIYRHPNMDTTKFIDEKLNDLMMKLSLERNKKVYIAGDFNFDLLKISSHADTSNFYDKVTSNLLLPIISLPTKINNTNNTLIDNIFSNQFNPDTISGNLTVNISDHLPSFMITPRLNQNHLPKKHNMYTRDLKNFDRQNFLNEILLTDWNSTIVDDDANLSFNQFLAKANTIIDTYMPLKKMTNREFKRRYKPWITNGILNSISRKNKLINRYAKMKDEMRKQVAFEEYKALRNTINELIRKNKKSYYESFFAEHNNNIKKVWQGIKEIVNIKIKNYNTPSSIEVNNKVITDPKIICNSFNDYFVNIADDILETRKYEGNKHYTEYLNNPIQIAFAYDPCTANEVCILINELSISKASGPNGIPTKILQMISKEISTPLSKIFNIAVTSGTHPELLKLVDVIPIFKKGSRLLVSNYRPISLLSNLNKIFEKIMYKRIYNFIEKNNILYPLQFGFRAKHSTTHALINITEKIRSALDNSKVACGIFVDLQKAFDTVNHETLLHKLYHYGFRGIINDWFRSYLHERKQKVCLNGFESDIKTLHHGVPQGSVLGPILFLLYINDLHKCIKFSSTYHFADDTNLLNISDNYDILRANVNYDLHSLHEWLVSNKISLNNKKTELIYFHKARSKVPTELKIKMNGKRLTHSNNIKYLGVYLDETLMGSVHCEEHIKKLCRANGILAKARHFVPLNHLKNIYYATFSSNLFYGSQVWGQSLLTVADKISVLQRKAVRLMSFSEFNAHSNPIFKDLKILKVKDNIFLQNCLFVHDYFHSNLPTSFDNIFTKASNTHNNFTRHANNGYIVPPRYNSTNYGLKSVYKLCVDAWNKITNDQKIIDNEKKKT